MSKHEIILLKALLPVKFEICHTKNHIVPNHWHTHLEILYILNGNMQMCCNDIQYNLSAGDIFIVNSGDIHYTKAMGDTSLLLLQIPVTFLTEMIPHLDQIRFQSLFSANETTAYQEMKRILLSMMSIFSKKKNGYQFLFLSELHLFLHQLYTSFSTTIENPMEKTTTIRLRNIITYVENHFTEAISLQDISDELALNPEYFCRFFKKNMGTSFLEYVNMVRLTHIYNDLIETNDSITNITQHYGFTNYKVFNRMFKEVYGENASKVRGEEGRMWI